MNPVDVISLAYVAYGVVRGRKRGLADETYRLLRFGTALAAGCGLYGLVSGLIGKILSLGTDVSGPVGFIGTVAGTWSLLRLAKRTLTGWIAARLMPYQALGGAIAGGVRTLLIVLSIAATLHLASSAPGHDTVARHSVVGNMAGWILPGE